MCGNDRARVLACAEREAQKILLAPANGGLLPYVSRERRIAIQLYGNDNVAFLKPGAAVRNHILAPKLFSGGENANYNPC